MNGRKPSRADGRGPLVLLGDALLLFLALYGALFSFATAFSLQVEPLPLLAGCAVGALAALAVWSLPKYRWVPLLLAAGLWALALARLWDVLVLGEISLRCSVVNTFAVSLETNQFIQPIVQLPEETWTRAATALLLAALAPLSALLGAGIVRLRSFWVTFLLTFPLLALPLAITVTPAWPPLMALLACWGTLLLSSLTARYDLRGSARLNLFTLPAVALVLVLLTLAMPQDRYQRPQWADRANHSLTNWAVRLSDRLFPGLKLAGGGLAAADEEVDLSQAGPLRFSGRTVLDVRTQLRGRLYLRGFSSAVYTGESWEPLEELSYSSLSTQLFSPLASSGFPAGDADGDGPPELDRLQGYQPMNFPALADRDAFPDKDYAKVTVRNVGADPGCVYFPYHILTAPEELSGAQFVYDAYLAREDDVWTHTLYVQPRCDPLASSLTGAAGAAQTRYADFVERYYLQVPDELSDLLMEHLISSTADPDRWLPNGIENEHYQALVTGSYAGSREFWDRALSLEYAGLIADYLSVLAEYDPDTPTVPAGEDFVEYFLEESHRGYCMHFASAAVLLLRMMNIPARYVSGYVADIPASGRALVPDSNAHAWVEIYLDGYGWHPVEVTPAYAGGLPGQSGGEAETSAPTPTPSASPKPSASTAPSAAPTPTPTPAPEPEPSAAAPDLRILFLPGAVLLVLLLFLLRRRLTCRLRLRRLRREPANCAVLLAYRQLSRLERWGGCIPEEVEELAKKAKFSQHILTEEERQTAVQALLDQAGRADRSLSGWRRLVFRYLLGLH